MFFGVIAEPSTIGTRRMGARLRYGASGRTPSTVSPLTPVTSSLKKFPTRLRLLSQVSLWSGKSLESRAVLDSQRQDIKRFGMLVKVLQL